MAPTEWTCANPRHPSGAWHPATPLPFYSLRNWRARLRYRVNRRRWGCGCDAKSPELSQ